MPTLYGMIKGPPMEYLPREVVMSSDDDDDDDDDEDPEEDVW